MKNQKGSALIFTLIVLVAMLFGSIALFKSTDVSGMVAANLAFKEVSLSAADIAVQDATAYLNAIADPDVAAGPKYYSIQRKATTAGVVCSKQYDGTDCVTADYQWGNPLTVGTSQVWYVIDRLCEANPASNAELHCLVEKQYVSESHSAKTTLDADEKIAVFYRVTIKILGASNTESYVQVVIPKQI